MFSEKCVAQTQLLHVAVVDIYWTPQNIQPGTAIHAVEFFLVLKNVGSHMITRDDYANGLHILLIVDVAPGWWHVVEGEHGEPYPYFQYSWIWDEVSMYQGQQVTFRTTQGTVPQVAIEPVYVNEFVEGKYQVSVTLFDMAMGGEGFGSMSRQFTVGNPPENEMPFRPFMLSVWQQLLVVIVLAGIIGSLAFLAIQHRKSKGSKVAGDAGRQVSETTSTSKAPTSLESGGKICPSCGFTNSYLARNLCEKCGKALNQTGIAGKTRSETERTARTEYCFDCGFFRN
jgi:hypothetical protein